MSTTGLLDAIGRHIQPAAATLLGPGDIEVRAVAAIRVAMTSAVRVAATAGGPGQPALNHDPGGAKELGEERFLPNHIVILGNRESSVKKKSAFGHGIYSRKCENRGSERFILRRKVARTKPAASPYPPTKLSAKYSHGSIERPLVCAVPFISTVHDLSGISHRLSQSIAGTVTAKASVENKSIDALSDCEDLYRAAKSTTTVASGKLQQTNASRAKGLTTCRR